MTMSLDELDEVAQARGAAVEETASRPLIRVAGLDKRYPVRQGDM